MKNLVIDGHNLAFRVLHALPPDLKGPENESTSVFFGFMRSLIAAKRMVDPSAKVFVAWDRGSHRRKALNPEYKANRTASTTSGWLSRLETFLPLVGVTQVFQENEEADDVVASLLPSLEGPVVILTRDADFFQLVSNTVTVAVPGKNQTFVFYDPERVFQDFGVTPEQIPHWKAILGDTSDNIRGVPRFPSKVAACLLRDHKTIEGVFQSGFSGLTSKQYASLKASKDVVVKNLSLTTMIRNLEFTTVSPEPSLEKAESVLTELGITTLPLTSFFGPKQGFLKFG
jgi:DNA polymerase-1